MSGTAGFGISPILRSNIVAEIPPVHRCRVPDLLAVAETTGLPCVFPCLVQRRQKHTGQNGDNCNGDQKFYQRKISMSRNPE